MTIRCIKDITDAYEAGRWHSQRFTKAAGQTGDGQWQDWAYTSGQPAYDARIGNALERTPVVASRNDAIWFPDIAAGLDRRLVGLRTYTTASGNDQATVEFQLYDLLAVYPLIDGDSTDLQVMDNTQALPRYADGLGVQAVLVNHVAPAVGAGDVTVSYIDHAGSSRSLTVTATTYGLGKAAFTLNGTGNSGPLFLPLGSGSRGVRDITSVQFSVAPGGLWCIYLVRPLATTSNRGGRSGVNETCWSERCLCAQDAFRLPQILDGAHLGFFYMPNGGARTVAILGAATFVWG
jgi:hypothetical protein